MHVFNCYTHIMERKDSENTYCYYSDLPSPMAYMEESENESGKVKTTEAEIAHKISAKAITLLSEEQEKRSTKLSGKSLKHLTAIEINRIIEMAWEDRTPFDAISFQFGLSEEQVKQLMKKELRFSSYKLWRQRVEACKTKHVAKRVDAINRFKCSRQKNISINKISKRRFRSY